MPISDKQLNRDYQREWARRKKLGIDTKGILDSVIPDRVSKVLLTPEERKRNKLENTKRHRIKIKNEMEKLLGSQCMICKSKQSLMAHEIYGSSHNGHNSGMLFADALDRPQDFIRLCYSCHKGVHWVMKWFNMSWDDIISKIGAPIV